MGDLTAIDRYLADKAEAIRATARTAVYDIGEHLTEARKKCPHGKWLPWLENEFGWSHTTADKYMAIYSAIARGKLRPKVQFGLGVSSLALLASPSTPDEARNDVTERLESGEKLTRQDVEKTIAKHKPPTDEKRRDRWLNDQRRKRETAPHVPTTPADPASEQSAEARKALHADDAPPPAPSAAPASHEDIVARDAGRIAQTLNILIGLIEHVSPQQFAERADSDAVDSAMAATAWLAQLTDLLGSSDEPDEPQTRTWRNLAPLGSLLKRR